MDRVFIENLRIDCIIGVTEEERRRPQKVIVEVAFDVNLGRAAASEALKDTVDYREAKLQISRFVSGGKFRLLESLAEGIAKVALDRFKRVDGVVVKVRKEKYSVEPSIGIEIERRRRRKPR